MILILIRLLIVILILIRLLIMILILFRLLIMIPIIELLMPPTTTTFRPPGKTCVAVIQLPTQTYKEVMMKTYGTQD